MRITGPLLVELRVRFPEPTSPAESVSAAELPDVFVMVRLFWRVMGRAIVTAALEVSQMDGAAEVLELVTKVSPPATPPNTVMAPVFVPPNSSAFTRV